jgi:2,3-bisphosphoglycerate-dependent phosphoglycerate mutase
MTEPGRKNEGQKNEGQKSEAEIPGQEIAELFRKALRGEAKIFTVGAAWTDIYASNVEVRIEGYKLVIFNDCNQVDYVDHAIAPDGRAADFDDWFFSNTEPVDLLTDDEQTRLEFLMEAAPVLPDGEMPAGSTVH